MHLLHKSYSHLRWHDNPSQTVAVRQQGGDSSRWRDEYDWRGQNVLPVTHSSSCSFTFTIIRHAAAKKSATTWSLLLNIMSNNVMSTYNLVSQDFFCLFVSFYFTSHIYIYICSSLYSLSCIPSIVFMSVGTYTSNPMGIAIYSVFGYLEKRYINLRYYYSHRSSTFNAKSWR